MSYKKGLLLSAILLSSGFIFGMEQDIKKIKCDLSLLNLNADSVDINALPNELVQYLASFLDLKSKLILRVTNKNFEENINDISKIKDHFKNKLGLLLIKCIQSKKDNVVYLLIKSLKKFNFDFNLQDEKGKTALFCACHDGHKDLVEILINAKVNLNLQNENGRTALMCACKKGHYNIVKLLIKFGADLNLQDRWKRTAFTFANGMNHIDIMKLLIENGVNIDMPDDAGYTILHWASVTGFIAAVELLLKSGADPNIKNEFGKTALDSAKDERIIKLLKNKMGLEEMPCSICFEAVKKEEIDLACGHNKCFHRECLDEWLNKNNPCPICRAKIIKK